MLDFRKILYINCESKIYKEILYTIFRQNHVVSITTFFFSKKIHLRYKYSNDLFIYLFLLKMQCILGEFGLNYRQFVYDSEYRYFYAEKTNDY